MARPLRFRYSPGQWTLDRVRRSVYSPLDDNLGAKMRPTWFKPPDSYEARRFEMDNGDVALLLWTDGDRGPSGVGGGPAAYWIGNTETPRALWKTDKYGFESVPDPVSEWTERELLAQLHEESPWLAEYPTLSWFFLPVFLSKDGRETTRSFFYDHAAGFPDIDRSTALSFYEQFLETGVFDDHRELMAGKLGTSERIDWTRMTAAMGEFNAAKLLVDAGYDVSPEIEVSTGHSIDFRADPADSDGTDGVLVEVTRPLPPGRRSADSPIVAIRDTAASKASGQLDHHGGGVVLFVDCSSFRDDDWRAILDAEPSVRHRPAVVFRTRPTGRTEAYTVGSVPLSIQDALASPASR